MVAQRKKTDSGKGFWRHPVTILVLSAIVLPGAVGLSYKVIPYTTLLLAQINHDHEILEGQRSSIMENSADIDTLETDVNCLKLDMIEMQEQMAEQQEDTNELLRALYYEQTGREWREIP